MVDYGNTVNPLPGVETDGLLVYRFTGLLVPWFIGLLVYWFTGSLVDWFTGALVYWFPEPRNAAKIEPP